MTSEFKIIEKYFKRKTKDTELGIGDDAAVLSVPENKSLLVTVDTMVEGVHFLADDDPFALGHKLMAVNLSDIAAMGGVPKWATLALSLPKSKANDDWLKPFSEGLFDQAAQHSVTLVGGDTSRAEQLVLSIQMMGLVEKTKAIVRSGAKVGDAIYVSGALGGAAFALAQKLDLDNSGLVDVSTLKPLHFPQAQVALGSGLQDTATAMIDVSDGLLQDLGHILKASGVGAEVSVLDVPVAKTCVDLSDPLKYQYALTGGEEYQLCFTAPERHTQKIRALAEQYAVSITKIGVVVQKEAGKDTISFLDLPESVRLDYQGYTHF